MDVDPVGPDGYAFLDDIDAAVGAVDVEVDEFHAGDKAHVHRLGQLVGDEFLEAAAVFPVLQVKGE